MTVATQIERTSDETPGARRLRNAFEAAARMPVLADNRERLCNTADPDRTTGVPAAVDLIGTVGVSTAVVHDIGKLALADLEGSSPTVEHSHATPAERLRARPARPPWSGSRT